MDYDPQTPSLPYDPPENFRVDEQDGFNEWTEVENPFHDDLPPGGQVPRMLTAKFESSSRQAEIFIHDPVNALLAIDDSIVTNASLDPEFLRTARISTFVVNHERTLAKKVIRAVVLVDETSVGVTVHKQEPPGE
jgi:hypothetical protein